MYFSGITLRNFRNYKFLDLQFNKKLNIIIGSNAQGKTNLVESLYLSSLGKSFRTSNDKELTMFGCKESSVTVISSKDDIQTEIELKYIDGKKNIIINGENCNRNIDLLENNYVVVFSPEDLRIVKDEPEKRRKFIDRELCQLRPVYYKSLARYKKILAQRNSLLKQPCPDINYLSVWNDELIKYGALIIKYRSEFIEKLKGICQKIHSDITSGIEDLDVIYEPSVAFIDNIEEQKNHFRKILSECSENDFSRRTSTKGPHRDDIKLKVNGIDIRSFGSQGQQRTAALSLKLAELELIYEETGVRPILLLDDVLSELDENRQKYLIKSFSENQIFLTTTEISDLIKESLPEYTIFEVSSGTVKKI